MFRWIVCVLVLTSTANAQDFFAWKPQWLHRSDVDYVEPIRNYADGYNVAKAERRPILMFVTQKACAPCRLAKALIEDMRAEHALADCVLVQVDSGDDVARKLMVGRRFAPQLILVQELDKPPYVIETITRANIVLLLQRLKH